MSSKGGSKAPVKSIAENASTLPPQKPVKVYGSAIWPEMRTICNILDMANRSYKVEPACDIFSEAGQKEVALYNPAKVNPLVVINGTKILADPATLIKHICRHF